MVRPFRCVTAFLLVLTLLVTLLPTQVSEAAAPLTEEDALVMLQEYRVVRGDENGNVNVTDRITRAQAAALFVRSMGMESFASMLKDVVPFTDAKGHWAAGEIALAERMGLMRGDPSGQFRPDADITYVEILTVLLRMVDKEPAGAWDPSRIVFAANGLGITPTGIEPRSAAIRGRIFWALAMALTQVEVEGGRSLAQKHLDQSPPVIRLDMPSLTTQDEKVTITGTAHGASHVLVQGRPAKLDRKTGQFSGEAIVDVGENTVTVAAYDFARNEAITTLSVDRKGVIARLTITGPSYILANNNTSLTVEAKDSRGNTLPLDGVDVALTGNVATFDLATMTLRAGSTAGRGTLTLTAGRTRATYTFDVMAPASSAAKLVILPINNGRNPALNQEVNVTVQVVDELGQLVSTDYGRPITLRAEGLSGVTITPVQPISEKGITTYTLKGTRLGHLRLEAVSTGLTTASMELDILTEIRVLLSTTARSLKPDGTSSAIIRATLQDQNGRTINNPTSSDIMIQLTAAGTDGTLTDGHLTIPKGRSSSSGNDGSYTVGIAPGNVLIRGEFLSSHQYSVQSLTLPVTDPLPGVKIELTSTPASTQPGGSVTLTLKVVDGTNRVVTTGSYAFGLRASTSNNDPLVNGLPEGVEILFQGTNYTPVDDGRVATDPLNNPYSVVGRTDRGTATFTLRYSRSGIVTVTPVLQPASHEAYHPNLDLGAASPSTNLYAPSINVTFAGVPTAVVLTADSDLGVDEKGASANTAEPVKVRAKVVDASGAVVPGYAGTVTLSRLSGGTNASNIVGMNRKAAVNGVAEFTLQTGSANGFDQYRASTGSMFSENLTVSVHQMAADAPQIVAIRGVKEGDLSPVTGFVGPDADYMDIQLLPQASIVSGEPTNWVTAKVYRKGDSWPFFTSKAIDLASPLPIVKVPKSVLLPGEFQYEVVVNNGAGDSLRSPALDDTSRAMNAVYATNLRLSGASYDAVTQLLTLTGSMVADGRVDPSKIRFVKNDSVVSLSGATVQSLTYSTLVLHLPDQAPSLDTDVFFGSVYIEASAGWLTNKDSNQIAQPQTVTVAPMVTIFRAAIDPSYKYLYLYGDGFRQGTLAQNLLTVNGSDGSITLDVNADRITSVTDSQIVITLSDTSLNGIMALPGPLHITAQAGWLAGSQGRVGPITGTDHPVYLQAKVTSASYDRNTKTLILRGAGFAEATVQPGKITFQRSTSSVAWNPSSTPSVAPTANDEIRIVFSDTDAEAFESQFSGRVVYVNTLNGWLVDALGREAQPIPANSVLFTVPST